MSVSELTVWFPVPFALVTIPASFVAAAGLAVLVSKLTGWFLVSFALVTIPAPVCIHDTAFIYAVLRVELGKELLDRNSALAIITQVLLLASVRYVDVLSVELFTAFYTAVRVLMDTFVCVLTCLLARFVFRAVLCVRSVFPFQVKGA